MKICVDAGHGGHDSGAVAADGTREKDVVLTYAKALQEQLTGQGHSVLMTRKNDTFVGLSLRATKANEWEADVFVSLHANAALSSTARGAWIIHDDNTIQGIELASDVWSKFHQVPYLVDVDPTEEIYPDNSPWVGNRELTVVSTTKMPALLIELGFLTNTDDLSLLKNPETVQAVARAITDGIEAWGYRMKLFTPTPEIEKPVPDSIFRKERPMPVESWKSDAVVTAIDNAVVGESAGELAIRVLKNFADDPLVDSMLNGIKRTIIQLALGWLEKLLKKALGVTP